jgi:hypothetical protein
MPDAPITEMNEALLVRSEGEVDNDNERTTWVEYRLVSDPNAERAVHRSVHVRLKQAGVESIGAIGTFS